MKLSFNISDMNVKELTSNVQLGSMAFNLEADFAPLAKALFDPSVARGYWDLNKDVLVFFEQNPDIIANYIETIVGGVAKGLINAVDKQLSPFERIKIRVQCLLARMGLYKPQPTPSSAADLKSALAMYRDGLGDGKYGISGNMHPDNHYYQQGYDEGQAKRAQRMDAHESNHAKATPTFVPSDEHLAMAGSTNGTQEAK